MEDNLIDYVINEQDQILNTIGAFFELIHSSKKIIPKNAIHQQVTETFNTFIERKRTFENGNNLLVLIKHYYQIILMKHKTILLLKYIFSNFRNKLSSGIDNIPNIVLKNINQILINEYCKLFNNMLNNSYFSHKWKTEKPFFCPKRKRNLIVHRIYSQ